MLLSYLVYCHIWLNLPLDDRHLLQSFLWMVATSANHNISKKNVIQLRRELRNPGVSVVWLLHQLINHHNLLSSICYDHGLIANVGVDWVFGVSYTSWYWHTYLLTTNDTNGKCRLIMAQIIIRLFRSSQSYESQGHQIQWPFSLDFKLHSGHKWRGYCLVPMIWNFVKFSPISFSSVPCI